MPAFGPEQAGNMLNPGLRLAQLVKIGDTIERLEVIWFIIAIGAGIMTSVILIWATSMVILAEELIVFKDNKL